MPFSLFFKRVLLCLIVEYFFYLRPNKSVRERIQYNGYQENKHHEKLISKEFYTFVKRITKS